MPSPDIDDPPAARHSAQERTSLKNQKRWTPRGYKEPISWSQVVRSWSGLPYSSRLSGFSTLQSHVQIATEESV